MTTAETFRLLMTRISDLLTDEYDADMGEVPPATESISRASGLLYDACTRLRGTFPRGFASTTGRGDIRLYWRADDRDLHLTIPSSAQERTSLFSHLRGQENFVQDVSPEVLADSLSQFPPTMSGEGAHEWRQP